jgi:hypothetical protein
MLIAIITVAIITIARQKNTMSLFPFERYTQTISTWINDANPDFDKSLISAEMQQKRQQLFLDHYCGELSPWSSNGLNLVLKKSSPDDLKTMEENVITLFSNNKSTPKENIGYGENFRPYTEDWIKKLTNNIDLTQLEHLNYQENNRAIAIEKLQARALATQRDSLATQI